MIEKLEKFGLSQKEAKIYLTLLELGNAVVSDIAKQAGINRSTTYVLLKSLADRGFVGITERNGVKIYAAASPERIIQHLEDSIKKYTELVGVAHGILPELKSMYVGVGPKPHVRFFEGTEGIKTAYEDTLTSSETIRAYASIDDMHKALPDYFPEYYRRRAAKKIHIRAIFPDTAAARERILHNEEEERDAYLVPNDKFKFSSEINVYDNKVVFMSLVEKYGLIFESEEFARTIKNIFDLALVEAEMTDKRLTKKDHA